MKKSFVIDIMTFLALFVVTAAVSVATKGRFGEDYYVNQRIANYCIISTVGIIIIAVNKFFFKYSIPLHSPINLSAGFAFITAIALTVSAPLAIGITVTGAICLWVCVASDEEIVKKQLFVIDAVIMYALILGTLCYVPKYVPKYIGF